MTKTNENRRTVTARQARSLAVCYANFLPAFEAFANDKPMPDGSPSAPEVSLWGGMLKGAQLESGVEMIAPATLRYWVEKARMATQRATAREALDNIARNLDGATIA